MKINSHAERIALNPPRSPKPIKYWEAHIQTNFSGATQCIDTNNSIALLRHKYGNTVIYKSVR